MRLNNCCPVLVAVTVLAANPATTSQVFAQAGDIGGQVGKKSRTISGNHERPASQSPAKKKSKRAAAPAPDGSQEKPSTGCGNFFGIWTSGGGAWLYGPNDTTFRANGTARHNSGIDGTWRCSGGEIVLEWKGWDNDRLKLSTDGKRLNSLAGGRGFTR